MHITKDVIMKYLTEVFAAVHSGRYQISPRPKNQEIYVDYVFTEADAERIILSLTVEDFSDVAQNDHLHHKDEILYIFGKDVRLLPRYGKSAVEETVSLYIKFNKLSDNYVFVISLHKQEYPLVYKFKKQFDTEQRGNQL